MNRVSPGPARCADVHTVTCGQKQLRAGSDTDKLGRAQGMGRSAGSACAGVIMEAGGQRSSVPTPSVKNHRSQGKACSCFIGPYSKSHTSNNTGAVGTSQPSLSPQHHRQGVDP